MSFVGQREAGVAVPGGRRPADPGDPAAAGVANDFSGSASVVAQVGQVYGDVVFAAPRPVERQVPHQVPAADRWFVNRVAELAALGAGGDPGGDEPGEDPGGGTQLVLVTGARGVGKTALVRRWTAATMGRFAGGELYVDLAALRPPAGDTAVGEVLGECLRALGVAETSLPATAAARAGLFRTRTAATPVLVVLDDVSEPAQVTPLIPTAPGSVVVATCDRRLEELVGLEGADLHVVEPLDDEHARELLAALCPGQVADAGPADVRALVGLCGGLPIALRVAAARLRTDQSLRLADLVEEVRADLGALSLGGQASVTAVLTAAYRALPAGARQAYRVFGAAGGFELTAPAVAAALDVTPRAAGAVLTALLAANLVEQRPARRFRLYALTARHGAEQAAAHDPDRGPEPELRRLVRHYLVGAMAADVTVMGERLRYGRLDETTDPVPAAPSEAGEAGAGKAEALRWLAGERHNLRHVVRLAVRLGDDDSAWRLVEALAALYFNQRHPTELVGVCAEGIEAARRVGRGDVEARLRCVASRGLVDLGQLAAARAQVDAALASAVDGRDPLLLASVWEFRGRVAAAEGDLPAAIEAYARCLNLNAAVASEAISSEAISNEVISSETAASEEVGSETVASEAGGEAMGNEAIASAARGAAIARYLLGCALDADGRPDEALAPLAAAHQALRDGGDDRMAARARLATGTALAHLGRDREAQAALREAVAVFAALDAWHYEAQALQPLAGVAARLGDAAQARQCLTRALRIVDETDPRVPQLRDDLAALPAVDPADG